MLPERTWCRILRPTRTGMAGMLLTRGLWGGAAAHAYGDGGMRAVLIQALPGCGPRVRGWRDVRFREGGRRRLRPTRTGMAEDRSDGGEHASAAAHAYGD